jgi:integrase
MSIRKDKNSGIWQVDITIANQRVQRSSGTTDKKKAQELHNAIESQMWRQIKLGEQPKVLWDDLVLSYLEEKASKRSIEDDKDKLRWLHPHFEGEFIHDIDGNRIQEVLDMKRREINPRTKRQVSDSTVNRYAALLLTMFNHAVDRGWLTAVPRVSKRKEKKKTPRWIRQEEAQRLILELADTAAHIAQMVKFSLLTGLRQHNVTHLEWDRVDIDRGLAWILPEHAKGNDYISVPLNNDALAVLRAQIGKHARWVFPYNDSPVNYPANSAWKKALKRAEIGNFRWHDLRHTWASWHVQNGTTLAELQQLGGWKSIQMVLVYAHLAPHHTARSANNITLGFGEESVKNEIIVKPTIAASRMATGGTGGGRTHDQRIKSKVTE